MSEQTLHVCCEDAKWTLAIDDKGWWLDEDYRKGPYVKFCPFCGERLPEVNTKRED